MYRDNEKNKKVCEHEKAKYHVPMTPMLIALGSLLFLASSLSLTRGRQCITSGGRPRDTTYTNHWNVCILHFTSISWRHQTNLD